MRALVGLSPHILDKRLMLWGNERMQLTDEAIKQEVKNGLSVMEIAKKYDRAVITVLKRIQKIEGTGAISTKGTKIQHGTASTREIKLPNLKPFDLKKGDKIKALNEDGREKPGVEKFTVERIYGSHFVCSKATGGKYKVSFLKIDYRMGLIVRC